MKTWKKNVVAAAVLVTVCAGIYVNWLYTEEQSVQNLSDVLDAEKIMSPDLLLMSDESTLDAATDVFTADTYFAAVRLSRQEARDSAVALLQEAMAYGNDEQSEKTNAQLEEIVQIALCEAQIESLVIAKGYTDCVTYISDSGVSVAVASPEGGLAKDDVAVIADIVLTQSDYNMKDIHVIEVS